MWTRELADALRVAARRVKHGRYDWSDMAHCNCGILARELTGASYEQTWRLLDHPLLGACWSRIGQELICQTTGLPVNVLAARLLEAGLEPDDFEHLENLSNNTIRRRAGPCDFMPNHDYDHRGTVAKYMVGWADLIDRQLGPRPPIPVEVVPELVAPLG